MAQNKPLIILFNYGGGMRGLIPAHFMARLEEATGLRMIDMVDVFCGPSTGSILNSALNIPNKENPKRPKFRARHMVRFYERDGIKIFPPDRFRDFRGFIHDFNNRTMKIGQLNNLFKHGHYDPANLKRSLKALYGDHKLHDSLKNLVIPVYNIDGDQLKALAEEGESTETPVHTKNNFLDEGGHALWLKKMDNGADNSATPHVNLLDAVMASCAAPTYFPCHHFQARYSGFGQPHEYSGIDGSIFDNPCISYHGAIKQHIPPNTKVIMIILGTGYTLKSIKKEDWNRYGGLGVVDPVNDLPLINILFHASESALMDSFSQELGNNLYIFNQSLNADSGTDFNLPNHQIDDASPENLKRLESFAHSMIENNQKSFESLCHLLVSNYDRKNRKRKSLFGKLFSAFD
ncbi:MAG: patatin-like phospholipase family protein [Alphaproteobacteria bacterium]